MGQPKHGAFSPHWGKYHRNMEFKEELMEKRVEEEVLVKPRPRLADFAKAKRRFFPWVFHFHLPSFYEFFMAFVI
jgi:hypothetical protein